MTKSHPLDGIGLRIRNFMSFGNGGGDLGVFHPINFIIGRNNSGKSALVRVVNSVIMDSERGDFPESVTIWRQKIGKNAVHEGLSGSATRKIYADRLSDLERIRLSRFLMDADIEIYINYKGGIISVKGIELGGDFSNLSDGQVEDSIAPYVEVNRGAERVVHVNAERDASPEEHKKEYKLAPNGGGLTNVIQGFINADHLARDEVELHLLADLNAVYAGDCNFTRISVRRSEETTNWEVFLTEEHKGDIRLSQSGSSLKSILLILAMLRLKPLIDKKFDWSKTVFAIEEPENNAHPALLRRLLDFLAKARDEKGFTLIITTHSPLCIDWAAGRDDSQIIHVTHDGKEARSRVVVDHKLKGEILDDLGNRASDILQANGVIWVEGPSDRIYLRRWIELRSGGALREGAHYAVMFYGGKVLSHFHALAPDSEEVEDLVSLLRLNRNVAVMMDSDRATAGAGLDATKERVIAEVKGYGGMAWVTEGREVENYIPRDLLDKLAKGPLPKGSIKFTKIPEQRWVSPFVESKVKLARAVVAEDALTEDAMRDHLDLWDRVGELCGHIAKWNGITLAVDLDIPLPAAASSATP